MAASPSPSRSELLRPARSNKAHHHLTSGALSGLASAVVLQPLDLLKTRMQQGGGSRRSRISPAFRQVVREEGILGLWRGTVPTIARNVPGVAVYFYLLSEIRHGMTSIHFFSTAPRTQTPSSAILTPSSAASATAISPPPQPQAQSAASALPTLSPTGNLLSGAVARTAVGFVLSPFTIIKSRFESSLYPSYTSLPRSFSLILSTSGIPGFFQGFTATALRDAPYAGLYVGLYEEGKRIAGKLISPDWGIPYAAIHTTCGMSAAALATLTTSPADCIKTRMQVLPEANPTMRAAISSIYRERGLQGFLSGATLRISRKAASSAIAWTVYEGLLIIMRDKGLLKAV